MIASSEKKFDDTVIYCVDEVSKTIHNIDSVYIKDFKGHVKNRKPVSMVLFAMFLLEWMM